MSNTTAHHIINHLSTLVWWEMLSLSQWKLINLTQHQINEMRKTLSHTLNNPYELLAPLSQRHPLKELSELKKTFFLIRGICRKMLETLTTIQTEKDLATLLFSQLETVPVALPPTPHFPRTRKRNGNNSIAAEPYLYQPQLRPGTTDELVMLTNVERFTRWEIMYIFAEHTPSSWTRKKRGYFPDTNSHTPRCDDIEWVEIRTSSGDIFLWYKSEQYKYNYLWDVFLINLLDMAAESNNNTSMPPDVFQGECLARYIVSCLFKQEKEQTRITFDESFYTYWLHTFSEQRDNHEETIDIFIESFWLPPELRNIRQYCHAWVVKHISEWTITQQLVDDFTSDTSKYTIRNSGQHKALIVEIRKLFDLFRKQHYLPDQIITELIQVGQHPTPHSRQKPSRQAKQ